MPLKAQGPYGNGSAALASGNGSTDFTFKSGVSNVRIDAQVIKDGAIVHGLTKEDFLVFDGAAPQPVVYFGRESEPLTLLLLLDVSGSVQKHIEQIASVARDSLRVLNKGDRVGVMVFARDTAVVLPFTEDLDAVARELKKAVSEQNVGTSTSINDGLLTAARYMGENAGKTGRRAILILTDNLGLNYKSPDQPVINALWESDTVLNGLVVGKGERPPPITAGRYTNPDFTPPDVFLIAEETGGETVRAARASTAFPQMVERIRTRYSLHIRVPDGATGFRAVRVELTPEAKQRFPGAQIRARRGYRAQP